MNQINNEGTTYEWFLKGGYIGIWFWLRSPYSGHNNLFFTYGQGNIDNNYANTAIIVCPAFVIG